MTDETGVVRRMLRRMPLLLATPLVFLAALIAGVPLVVPVDYEIAQRVAWFHYDRCSERAELWGPQFSAPMIVTSIFIFYVILHSRRTWVRKRPFLLAAVAWAASVLLGLWFLRQDIEAYCGPF